MLYIFNMKTAKPKQGRPKSTSPPRHKVIFVRVDEEMIKALDMCASEEMSLKPGMYISRANIVRALLHSALAAK